MIASGRCRHGEVETAERAFRGRPGGRSARRLHRRLGRGRSPLGARPRRPRRAQDRLSHPSFGGRLLGRAPASQSQRFRKSLRNKRNRLEHQHEVTSTGTRTPNPSTAISTRHSAHRARFRTHSCFFCGDHEPFQREFATLAHERGWLRLLLLELDGEPACFEYGLPSSRTRTSPIRAVEPRLGPPLRRVPRRDRRMRRSFEEGAAEYRFLGGEEGYKYRFPIEDPRLETVSVPASPRGRVAAGALGAALRLPGEGRPPPNRLLEFRNARREAARRVPGTPSGRGAAARASARRTCTGDGIRRARRSRRRGRPCSGRRGGAGSPEPGESGRDRAPRRLRARRGGLLRTTQVGRPRPGRTRRRRRR